MKTTTKRNAKNRITVKKGSDNVFADLRLANPKELLAKAELAAAIHQEIKRLGLTQTEAAKRLGILQPRVSALLTGHLTLFSTDALIQYLTALGRDVNISIGNSRGKKAGKVTVALTAP